VRRLLLVGAALGALALAPSGLAAGPAPWCGTDQTPQDRVPEATAGPQVHVIYATPADGTDAAAQWAPQIVGDLTEVDAWWRGQDPARTPRFDLYPFPNCSLGLGALDLSDVRLSATSAQLRPTEGRYSRIANELHATFSSRYKKYLVFYDGPADGSVCGQGSGDYSNGPSYAIVYLGSDCGEFGVPSSAVAAHEFVHSLGALPGGAPHGCPGDPGHPCDSTLDLLYPQITGGVPLSSLLLDYGHDDYYGHSGSWPDLQDSAWLLHVGAQTQLAVTVSGSGTVESDAPGVDCPATCTSTWDTGSVVGLSATPGKGQRLGRWSGACTGDGNCDVTLDQAKTVNAQFVRDVYKLQVRITGKGRVAGGGISCPSRCAAVLEAGRTVRLRATPAKGWRFRRWGGPCVTASSSCAVPVNAATTARATFVKVAGR
jgi:hypothetical protein